jgi:hypothetical protein
MKRKLISAPPRKYTVEKLISVVLETTNIAEAIKGLGLANNDETRVSILNRIERMNIDTSHWDETIHIKRYIPSSEYTEGLKPIRGSNLKAKLLEEGLIENKCSICSIGPIWNGKSIVLQMDHINGNREDNRLNNLRIICPNCHNQTGTFCRKNKRRYSQKEE